MSRRSSSARSSHFRERQSIEGAFSMDVDGPGHAPHGARYAAAFDHRLPAHRPRSMCFSIGSGNFIFEFGPADPAAGPHDRDPGAIGRQPYTDFPAAEPRDQAITEMLHLNDGGEPSVAGQEEAPFFFHGHARPG